MKPAVLKILAQVTQEYDQALQGGALVEKSEKAKREQARATGGVQRAVKGALVESLTKKLVKAAWMEKEENNNWGRLSFERPEGKQKISIPIKEEYIHQLKNEEVKKYLLQNKAQYNYLLKQDINVVIGREFVVSIECKAFTENAMLKRIMIDAWLLHHIHPNLKFILVQLESSLGGNYGDPNLQLRPRGSSSSHTIMSYFPEINMNIITLLDGERKVPQPIHHPQFFKPLKQENLENAVKLLGKIL